MVCARSLYAALLSLLVLQSADALPMKGSTSRLARRARIANNSNNNIKRQEKSHTIHIEGGVSGSTINVNLGVRGQQRAKSVGDHSVLVDASSFSPATLGNLTSATSGSGIRNSTINLTVIDGAKRRSLSLRSLLSRWFNDNTTPKRSTITVAKKSIQIQPALERRAAASTTPRQRTKVAPQSLATINVAGKFVPAQQSQSQSQSKQTNARTKVLPMTGSFVYKVAATATALPVTIPTAHQHQGNQRTKNMRTKTRPGVQAPTGAPIKIAPLGDDSAAATRPYGSPVVYPANAYTVAPSQLTAYVSIPTAPVAVVVSSAIERAPPMAVVPVVASIVRAPNAQTHAAKRQRFARVKRATI